MVRSQHYRCRNCGAPHGGMVRDYCPDCVTKAVGDNARLVRGEWECVHCGGGLVTDALRGVIGCRRGCFAADPARHGA